MKVSVRKRNTMENYLGIKGWVWAGWYRLERYLYTLQRLSGLGILFYLAMHLIVNGFRLAGAEGWEGVMSLFRSPGFKVGEYLVIAAAIFHGLNGIRLILQELGFLLARPKPPVYPYRDSLRRRRPIVLAMGALVIVFLLVVLIDFVI